MNKIIAILIAAALVFTGCRSNRASTSTETVGGYTQISAEAGSDTMRSAGVETGTVNNSEYEQHADSAVLTIERDSIGLPVRLIFQSSGFSKTYGRSATAGTTASKTTLVRNGRKEESNNGYSYSKVDNKTTAPKERKSWVWLVLGVLGIFLFFNWPCKRKQ